MRRSRGEQAPPFALFPFIAVLLCSVGALVVLLVVMNQIGARKAALASRAAEAAVDSADAAPRAAEARKRLDEARAYRAKLDQARDESSRTLADEQTRLRGIEGHVRKLQDQVEKLRAEATELFALEQDHYDDAAMAARELRRLNELVEDQSKEVDELRTAATGRQRRYAIVPLREGRGGSNRPAVYFECVEDGVIMQPEGVKLSRQDFMPPVHVSSPLAAAARAVEQFYKDHPEARAAGEEGAPYPLLVVRPEGVSAYFRARAVFEAIDFDYGYQPVDRDWPIEYESPNPLLAEQALRAIDLARLERERLAAAAPQLFRPKGPGWETGTDDTDPAMGRGSFASAGMTTGGDNGAPGSVGAASHNPFVGLVSGSPGHGSVVLNEAQAARLRAANGGPSSGSAADNDFAPGAGAVGGTFAPGAGGRAAGPPGAEELVGPSLGAQGGGGHPLLEDPLRSDRQGGGTGGAGSGAADPSAGGAGGTLAQGAASSGVRPSGGDASNTRSDRIVMNPGQGGGAGPSGNPFGGDPSGQPPAPGAGGTIGTAASGGMTSAAAGGVPDPLALERPQGATSGAPASHLNPQAPPSASALAKDAPAPAAPQPPKGRSADRTREGVAMVRTISLEVSADAMAIVEDRRGVAGSGAQVALGDSAYAAREAVFSALKQHADTWGIPGDGMYWQPRLQLRVAPGGESRASELVTLFEASGLSVQPSTATSASGSGGSDASQLR
ncbi:MAG: hypothetical protein ACRCT8_08410 [Lacipirellulaceae bacterium]